MNISAHTKPPAVRLHPSRFRLVFSLLKCCCLCNLSVFVPHSLPAVQHLQPPDLLRIAVEVLALHLLEGGSRGRRRADVGCAVALLLWSHCVRKECGWTRGIVVCLAEAEVTVKVQVRLAQKLEIAALPLMAVARFPTGAGAAGRERRRLVSALRGYHSAITFIASQRMNYYHPHNCCYIPISTYLVG
jgi:hypothetical protein